MSRISNRLSTHTGTVLGTSSAGSHVIVNAGTDSGSWSSGVITLNASGATGGLAPYTYQWSIYSGGTGTFSDATSLTSTWTPDAAGSYVLILKATDASGKIGTGAVTIRLSTPAQILGSLLFADYWAEDADNPGAVNPDIVIATGVSSWPEEAARNVAMAQATGSKQPALSATSFGGRPGVTFTAGSAHYLSGTLSPTVAVGSRVYQWLVFNFTSTTTTDYADVALLANGGGNTSGCEMGTNASDLFGAWQDLSDGADDLRSKHAVTTTPCVWESGLLTSTTAKLVVNGTAYNGTKTGTVPGAAYNKIALGGNRADAEHAPVCIHRYVVAHNTASPTALPSAQQLLQMRSLLNKLRDNQWP